MKVSFEKRSPAPNADGTVDEPVEYVAIEMPASKDIVHRAATDADKLRHWHEYKAFKPEAAKPEAKDRVTTPEVIELPPADEAPAEETTKKKSFFKK